ncbi:hypothetical protein LIER_43853 [Lithospermum erythrorhizon]|uniref:Uncharacterized protein n=1 Tax=Lithospermum erythrorhizon TaxID=34254 RepID=A0AAV3R2M7_LITER
MVNLVGITTFQGEREGFTGPGIDDSGPTVDDLQSGYDNTPLSGTQRRSKRKIVREYYVYKLQDRPNDKSYILRFGRLF